VNFLRHVQHFFKTAYTFSPLKPNIRANKGLRIGLRIGLGIGFRIGLSIEFSILIGLGLRLVLRRARVRVKSLSFREKIKF
jgi:hypothetical protein